MSNPCLILDITDCANWPNFFNAAAPSDLERHPVRIPQDCRPTVLQPNEQTAMAEARRLASEHPSRRFAVFEAKLLGLAVDVPSHVTVAGHVLLTSKVARIVEIGDGIPF